MNSRGVELQGVKELADDEPIPAESSKASGHWRKKHCQWTPPPDRISTGAQPRYISPAAPRTRNSENQLGSMESRTWVIKPSIMTERRTTFLLIVTSSNQSQVNETPCRVLQIILTYSGITNYSVGQRSHPIYRPSRVSFFVLSPLRWKICVQRDFQLSEMTHRPPI